MEKHFEKLREVKKIKNEEEFWRAEKIFKTELNNLNPKLFWKSPSKYVSLFEELMNLAAEKEIITKECAKKHIDKLHKELASPEKFKQDMKGGARKIKKLIKLKLQKFRKMK